jgi:zinc/manganese transport system substrate-binding protein
MKTLLLILSVLSYGLTARAELKVVTTLPDLKVVAAEIGGDEVSVDAIVKGTKDPHYVEAKPSFMTKAMKADLVISIGLDLETAWLPSILRGARNPKVMKGRLGYLEVGPLVRPLEVPSGAMTRSEGDVHPYGNPHVTLDPIRMGEIAVKIGERLGELDPAHRETFLNRAKSLQNRLQEKTKVWQKRVESSGVKSVVTYHKTLTYFLDRFGLANTAILEPKPGIPPTSGHTLEVIALLKKEKAPVVLVENYFDSGILKKIRQDVPNLKSAVVAVAVEGEAGIKSLDDLYEELVRAVEKGK